MRLVCGDNEVVFLIFTGYVCAGSLSLILLAIDPETTPRPKLLSPEIAVEVAAPRQSRICYIASICLYKEMANKLFVVLLRYKSHNFTGLVFLLLLISTAIMPSEQQPRHSASPPFVLGLDC